MPDFIGIYLKNNNSRFIYRGKTINTSDKLLINGSAEFECKIIQIKNDPEQGFALDVIGFFMLNNEKMQKKNRTILRLWGKKKRFKLSVHANNEIMYVYNIWDFGKGTSYGQNSSAMIFEDIPNGRRYYCNDCRNNEDFDDIVFELTILKGDAKFLVPAELPPGSPDWSEMPDAEK